MRRRRTTRRRPRRTDCDSVTWLHGSRDPSISRCAPVNHQVSTRLLYVYWSILCRRLVHDGLRAPAISWVRLGSVTLYIPRVGLYLWNRTLFYVKLTYLVTVIVASDNFVLLLFSMSKMETVTEITAVLNIVWLLIDCAWFLRHPACICEQYFIWWTCFSLACSSGGGFELGWSHVQVCCVLSSVLRCRLVVVVAWCRFLSLSVCLSVCRHLLSSSESRCCHGASQLTGNNLQAQSPLRKPTALPSECRTVSTWTIPPSDISL